MSLYVKYTGSGASYPGIPARDMTQEEYRALTAEQEKIVAHSDIYQIVRQKDAPVITSAKEQ